MGKIEIRKAASHLRKIWSIGNEYLQRAQPWTMIKTNKEEAAKVIRFGFNLMLFFSKISEPFIPETSNKIKYCIGKSNDELQWPTTKKDFASNFETVRFGENFKPVENLFTKISDAEARDLEDRFAGTTN